MAKDKLVSLAEAVGALPCENPEQGDWGRNFAIEASEVVARIEGHLGMTICPPPIDGGLYKIWANGALFGERDCNAIYTAWLMSQSLADRDSPSVCEIGGGVGRVAYWSSRFGMLNYMIIDLPHINVLQAFYVIKSLPGVPVVLYGESASRRDNSSSIAIVPYFARNQIITKPLDLVLNQDSFPEIHPQTVCDYLEWMKTTTKWFLSVNHESEPKSVGDTVQNNVSKLIERVGGYHRRSRHLYWLRRGYVAELYEVGKLR